MHAADSYVEPAYNRDWYLDPLFNQFPVLNSPDDSVGMGSSDRQVQVHVLFVLRTVVLLHHPPRSAFLPFQLLGGLPRKTQRRRLGNVVDMGSDARRLGIPDACFEKESLTGRSRESKGRIGKEP